MSDDTPSPSASLPVRFYQLVITLGSWFAPLLLLTMRVVWGYQFFQTGKGKLTNLDRVANYFASLNIPMPKVNAAMAGSAECFGGALILVGLCGRLAAIPLMIVMAVAYWTAERANINSLDDFVKAAPFPFLVTVLVVFAFGPGVLSIDGLLKYTVFRKHIRPVGFPVA